MKSRMTDPRTYLIRMGIILAITAAIIALLWSQLASAFAGNIALNSVIVATALIGVAFIFRQTLRLVPETKWLAQIQKTNRINPTPSGSSLRAVAGSRARGRDTFALVASPHPPMAKERSELASVEPGAADRMRTRGSARSSPYERA